MSMEFVPSRECACDLIGFASRLRSACPILAASSRPRQLQALTLHRARAGQAPTADGLRGRGLESIVAAVPARRRGRGRGRNLVVVLLRILGAAAVANARRKEMHHDRLLFLERFENLRGRAVALEAVRGKESAGEDKGERVGRELVVARHLQQGLEERHDVDERRHVLGGQPLERAEHALERRVARDAAVPHLGRHHRRRQGTQQLQQHLAQRQGRERRGKGPPRVKALPHLCCLLPRPVVQEQSVALHPPLVQGAYQPPDLVGQLRLLLHRPMCGCDGWRGTHGMAAPREVREGAAKARGEALGTHGDDRARVLRAAVDFDDDERLERDDVVAEQRGSNAVADMHCNHNLDRLARHQHATRRCRHHPRRRVRVSCPEHHRREREVHSHLPCVSQPHLPPLPQPVPHCLQHHLRHVELGRREARGCRRIQLRLD
mmetsp:Transcript_62145/g.128901  ORF Transcript_62145/g.128901 Transcript_62145/m.128901 type:complete len:435 (-) Transcript_62145:2014-3318(-)